MIKKLLCKLRHGHEMEQFDTIRYINGYPIIRYGKRCRLGCGKIKWMR